MGTIKKYAILISSLLLCGMLVMYLNNLRPRFNEVEEEYKHNRAINLSREVDPNKLSQILIANGYVATQRDADFIADTLTARLQRGIRFSNIYHLLKRDYGYVPATVVEKENVLTNKLSLSYEELGLIDSLPALAELGIQLNLGRENGDGKIIVCVYEEKKRGRILNMLWGSKKVRCPDVLVCLKEYYVDSVEHADVVGYAKTNSKGRVVFNGLDRTHGYSVLPIKKGYEYGSSKGIVQGEFSKRGNKIHFYQQEHRIKIINNLTLRQIKHDGTITVRTPEEFVTNVVVWFALVLFTWWLLVLIMRFRKSYIDPFLFAAVMFLTGLCIIVMFAIHDPLTEDLEGVVMAQGVLIGIGVIALLQCVDFVKFYQGQCRFGFELPMELVKWGISPFVEQTRCSISALHNNAPWYKKALSMVALVVTSIVDVLILPLRLLLKIDVPKLSSFKLRIKKGVRSVPDGLSWLLFALLLTLLLFPFGKSVGGVKVNLALPGLPVFQPSEIVKYLILFFTAAFFTQKADFIVAYSQPNVNKFGAKMKTLAWVVAGLLLLFLLYIKLEDMGPAMVVIFTFILLYSLVKSKVSFENLTEGEKMKKLFTCDFAMLIYGVATFAIVIKVGYWLSGTKIALLFACFWFIVWFLYGKFRLKQVVESAMVFNMLVFIFVFGGVVIKSVNTDLGERFEQRTSMCVNTWGDLDINSEEPDYEQGKEAKPVSNTQVANGLWAIATGGLTGQGFGDGNPNLIPAFQTDMILSSMAEQIGWIGLALVVTALMLLLWRIVRVGYGVKHLFAFYFCIGVSIATAVQFFIIALGSSGVIPLTGITVPFLSYGRASMIVNLAAIGVVISLCKNIEREHLTETQQRIRKNSVGGYNHTTPLVLLTFGIIAIFTLGTWAKFAWGCFGRNKTLVRPAYVLSKDGWPTIEYNPRIELLTKRMRTGNIYDRNEVLLATNDKDNKRYYPFAEQLFFMIGDQNLSPVFGYYERYPLGYMADLQLNSYLCGYDNLHDEKGQPTLEVTLHSDKIKSQHRYLNCYKQGSVTCTLKDNHELVKYLRNGIHGRKIRNHNKMVQDGEYDIFLTLDAKLQVDMQNRLGKYVADKKHGLINNNLLRISVVVLDAENGDLLTSANYPLPNYQRLREEASHGYSDNYKDKDWLTYTDRDLGLVRQTAPGSTAKIMSAMAGFQKLGTAAADKKYLVTKDDIVERGSAVEPYKGLYYPRHKKSVDSVDMWWAIVESSNCYFINLVNENDLYWALDSIYEAIGAAIGNTIPYSFTKKTNVDRQNIFREKIANNQEVALAKYTNRIKGGSHKCMNEGEWRWAWGQGYGDYELLASPLNMARVASAVVNKGKMPYTQYVLQKGKYGKILRNENEVRLLSNKCAKKLMGYMKAESANQKARNGVALPSFVGGKTGTAQRYRETASGTPKLNDGWYMFFIEGHNGKHSLAVCVRMERRVGSGAAVRLTEAVVLESLYANGYINR